ncbi:MAG TPA: L-threonylcarbamoyladenylate synthase [Gemmataceae bacterium]|nr:L-threonylcarbamoyladenylate synthase [Gemmataceae bacterium]
MDPTARTRVLPIDPHDLDSQIVRVAAEVIRRGGLVAFPTETVYGLGANALDEEAVRGIFDAKGRPAGNPLIVHAVGEGMVRQVVADWPPLAHSLAERFWPGAITLVLPKGPAISGIVTGGGDTVAVRWPGHPVAQALIRETGLPIAAPSANRSSELSPTLAEHVERSLGGRIDVILDGGPTANGIESTVLDLTSDPPTVLRPGPISIAELERVVGKVGRGSGGSITGRAPSPGMLARHYAPRTPIELCADSSELDDRIRKESGSGRRVGVIGIGSDGGSATEFIRMPADPQVYGARLYAVLHDLDARGFDCIFVEMPPDTDAWVAIRDRLTRAGSPR